MTQYQSQNAAHKLDGYYLPRQNETIESAFARAKSELLANLKNDMADCENMTLETFMSETRRRDA